MSTHCLSILVALTLLSHSLSANCGEPGTVREGNGTCSRCPVGTENRDQKFYPGCTPCRVGTAAFMNGKTPVRICSLCPQGTFSDREGSASCTPCPPGTVSMGGSANCVAPKCGPGLELDFIAPLEVGCDKCRENFFSDGEDNRDCKLCPLGSISAEGSRQCTKCPKGTLGTPASSLQKCEKCLPGTYGDLEGAINCKICRPGTFSRKGATECTPCPAGQFAPLIASRKCKPCPTGTTSVKGSAACKHPTRGCTRDTFDNGNGKCNACMPGERLDAKNKKCVPCDKGEVSEGGATTSCRRCTDGKVPVKNVAFEDGLVCRCPVGTLEEFEGGPCKPCEAGEVGQLSAGIFKTYTGAPESRGTRAANSLSCIICPNGVVEDIPDFPQCAPCPTNPLTGFRQCDVTKCPKGLVRSSQRGDRPACIDPQTGCGENEVLDRGQCRVLQCPPSTFLGFEDCLFCPRGFRYNGKKLCIRCGRNQISDGGDSVNCENCPPNMDGVDGDCVCKKRLELKDGMCVRCMPGTFKREAGKLPCQPCPTGHAAKNKGAESCKKCGKGEIANEDKTRCVKCKKGFIVGANIRGDPIDKCVPRDPYQKI